jgi:hypothetical protein
MAIYENESIKRNIGTSAYGIDSTYADPSNYTSPTASQATEFYFGSVINSLSSINYRTCFGGSMMPEFVEDVEGDANDGSTFTLYPNPSGGLINIDYDIPSESKAELIVYSINGQMVHSEKLIDGKNTSLMDITTLERGLYFYSVLIDGAVKHVGRISKAK